METHPDEERLSALIAYETMRRDKAAHSKRRAEQFAGVVDRAAGAFALRLVALRLDSDDRTARAAVQAAERRFLRACHARETVYRQLDARGGHEAADGLYRRGPGWQRLADALALYDGDLLATGLACA